jgi:drug/metabolite transporter (DMT)-like permease
MLPDALGYLALTGRTLGLGLERPLVKALTLRRDSVAATTLYFGLGELMLIPLWAWQWLHDPAYVARIGAWIIPALITGVIYAVAFHTYVYAMSIGEVSYLTPLYATSFIWLYFLDVIFGDARLSWLPALGVLAVTLGIAFLSGVPRAGGRGSRPAPPLPRVARNGPGKLFARLNPAFLLQNPGAWAMLVYAFGLATARLVDKRVADIAPHVLYAFINNSLCVLAGVAILGLRGRASRPLALLMERPGIALAGAVAGMGAYVLMLIALECFNPSVVEPVTQLSVFIAVGLGGLWFHEPVRARWLPSALVVLGAALLMASR